MISSSTTRCNQAPPGADGLAHPEVGSGRLDETLLRQHGCWLAQLAVAPVRPAAAVRRRNHSPQSVFYQAIQTTRKDCLYNMHVLGVIIWASYGVALSHEASAWLYFILWETRMCIIVYLGLAVHAGEPGHL